ncbi:hypothetical protein N7493_005221 [Penicillium malachiteum]|uniref:Uncharacterized protein n=1 Tax=Penicillium malachiteum TaxID=1324776 RepID=A0AAD6HM95_9EURO|nr:hypothetical protein N7493_005221 [Penicillium malachiteum]
MTVPPDPLQSTKISTVSEDSAARQATNGTEDPVHERPSRFRDAELLVTDTVPETELVESSESTDILAEIESPSVVLPVNVDVPSPSVVTVPVDAVQVEEVVELAVALADAVLAEEVTVLIASVGIKLSLLVVALGDAVVVAEAVAEVVVTVDVDEETEVLVE